MKKKLITGIILGIVLIVLALAGYFYLNSSEPRQLVGDEILEVTLTIDNGNPLDRIEVDLWKASSKDAPDAGISHTNEEGIAIFHVPDGEYEIGFNLNNFPSNLICPEQKTYVLVEKGIPASKTIVIEVKQEQ